MDQRSVITIAKHELILERSSRLKKIHININPQDGLIIRAPKHSSMETIQTVVRERSAWLSATLAQVRQICPRREYGEGEQIPFLDEKLTLRFVDGDKPGAIINDRIVSIAPRETDRETTRALLANIYRKLARQYIPDRIALLNQRHFQFKYSRVTIRDQQGILGSCSNRGNLNINLRLMLAPAVVTDYVLIHELAHLKELNHSRRFWELVTGACPDYRQHRLWLQEKGMNLYI